MKTDLFSISKIFTERLLRIPDYQRGYAWGIKQLKEYWNDLIQLESDKNHYIGVLTLENVPSSTIKEWEDDLWITQARNYESYYVVDGQQRLTTTIVLIQAITETLNNGEKLNFRTKTDIQRKYLFDSKDDGISRSYLFGYEKDNPSYEYLKTKIFMEKSDTSLDAQETIYTQNLKFAKDFFSECLNEYSKEDIEVIFTTLTQRFLFNIYVISEEIDVFVAFETMNNRGKDLSHLELLKNRLIYLSTKFESEDYEKVRLRKLINSCWKSVYHYLGKNKDNPLDDDLFLENHFILYFGHLHEEKEYRYSLRWLYSGYRKYYKEYLLEEMFTSKNINVSKSDEKKNVTIGDVKKYAESLKDSVEIWYQILNPLDSEFSDIEKVWLEKINRQGIASAAPLIMVFMQNETDESKRIRLLKIIERYLFFNYLVRYQHYLDMDNSIFLQYSSDMTRGKITSDGLLERLENRIERVAKEKQIYSIIKEALVILPFLTDF